MKPRIAFINQRYGLDVVGGSETYTRQLAERLIDRYEVEILTTCALDHTTWKNLYRPGEESIHGVRVRRFPTQKPRNHKQFEKLCRILHQPETATVSEQLKWVEEQGPYAPALIEYIRDHKNDYDALIFVTYLYYTTFFGIKEAGDKAILIPTAHNEAPIHLGIYQDVFSAPRALIFLTEEEREFVHRTFHNEKIPYDILGAGVTVPDQEPSEAAKSFAGRDYIAYVGRIEPAKGCAALFGYFSF